MIDDPELYGLVKQYADLVYKKPSAYKSGFQIRLYKRLGGTFTEDFKPKKLKEWFDAKWINVGDKDDYPTYRPTVRVNKDTPLTVDEIDKQNLKEQIKLKQKIKGKRNLPAFKPKNNLKV
jgi:hypothetical protein